MIIKVTAKDIRLGKPCARRNCPVALAASRAFGTKRIEAYSFELVVFHKDQGVFRIHPVPKKVENFIRRFDEGLPVEPFSFRVGKTGDINF